jgi:hypothetical protein
MALSFEWKIRGFCGGEVKEVRVSLGFSGMEAMMKMR